MLSSYADRIGLICFFFYLEDERNTYKDTETFASKVVTCVGQVVGMIVAKDQPSAQRAAKLVKVHYRDLGDPIITIQVSTKLFED